MNIYVGNLDWSVTSNDLEQAFAEYGEIDNATVITDKYSGRSRGFGFVEMPNNDEAQAAIEALNGEGIKGRNVKVNEAKPREKRPQRY